jgi:hypothetical protein
MCEADGASKGASVEHGRAKQFLVPAGSHSSWESADRAAGYFTTRADTPPRVNERTAGVYWRADPEDLSILVKRARPAAFCFFAFAHRACAAAEGQGSTRRERQSTLETRVIIVNHPRIT